jgi:hypothetical protein
MVVNSLAFLTTYLLKKQVFSQSVVKKTNPFTYLPLPSSYSFFITYFTYI